MFYSSYYGEFIGLEMSGDRGFGGVGAMIEALVWEVFCIVAAWPSSVDLTWKV